jgi:histidine triad (HIT) family protein
MGRPWMITEPRGIVQMECVFCKIISREAPATVVFESANSLAIIALKQVGKGHSILIPKTHSTNFLDIETPDLLALIEDSRQFGKQLVVEHQASGLNLLHAAGETAQQSVFHTHIHLVPRYPNDGLDLWFRSGF